MNEANEKEIQQKLKYKKIFKMIRSFVCIVVGVLGIITAVNLHFYGEWTMYEYYGGDAYSGIQNAAADTARNIDQLGELVEDGMKAVFYLFSIIFIAYGIIGVIESVKMNLKISTVTTTENDDFSSEDDGI